MALLNWMECGNTLFFGCIKNKGMLEVKEGPRNSYKMAGYKKSKGPIFSQKWPIFKNNTRGPLGRLTVL